MRLIATAKAGFYPLPDRITDLIIKSVRVAPGTATMLDACAGEGVALDRLAHAWGCEPFAIELSETRAADCAKRVPRTLCGSYQQLQAPDGFASILFANPPYSEDVTQGGRQELTWLEHCSRWLAPGGLLVYVVPEHIISRPQFESLMADYKYPAVYRFPEPEYSDYEQVVVFAIKRTEDDDSWVGRYRHYPSDPVLTLGDEQYPPSDAEEVATVARSFGHRMAAGRLLAPTTGRALQLPPRTVPAYFHLDGICPEHWAPGPTDGAYTTDQWVTLTADNGRVADITPLMPLRPGHIAQLLRAGNLDGSQIVDKGQPVLIKGSSEKIIVVTEDAIANKRFETERIVSRLSTLNLKTGELCTFRADQEPERMRKWFEKYGPELAEAVRKNFPPAFDPGPMEAWSGWDFDGMKPPSDKPLPGYDKIEVLPIQKSTAAAIEHRWRTHKAAVISGQTGTGKTTMGQAASVLARFEKVVIMCPTHLTAKWARECKACTSAGVVVPRKMADIDRFFAGDYRYLVLGKEYAKLGAPWKHVVVSRVKSQLAEHVEWLELDEPPYHRRVVKTVCEQVPYFQCPACGETISEGSDDKKRPVTADWFGDAKRKCQACQEPLWQNTWLTKKTKRFAPARYINRRFAGQYSLIIDEVHVVKAADSDQARAAQHLISGCVKLLAMTGTIYGGRASSIYHLLYKIDRGFRDLYNFDECAKFVRDHGLLQRVYDLEDYNSRYGYRRNNSGGRVREIPGCSPAMVGLLLDYTAFVKLADLGVELPSYTEEVDLVPCDPKVLRNTQTLQQSVKEVLREHPELLSQYLMACLGYPDCPEHAEAVGNRDTGIIATAPADLHPLGGWPKDKRLVEIFVQEKANGRKGVVFFPQVSKRDPQPRVKAILEAAGLRVAILRGDVSASKREDWIAKHEPDFDVLLTNGSLVETGLDLLWAKRIVVYGIYYSIFTLRQMVARSFRLGQSDAIVVTFLGYAGTMQEVAMKLIAKKTRASHQIEGELGDGLADHDEDGCDFMMELARAAAEANQLEIRADCHCRLD